VLGKKHLRRSRGKKENHPRDIKKKVLLIGLLYLVIPQVNHNRGEKKNKD